MRPRPPRRWATAAAAVAVAVTAVVGPLASTATAHPGDGNTADRDGDEVPAHKQAIYDQYGRLPDDLGQYAGQGVWGFFWDLPLPVDNDGWWAGWRNFGDWTALFWPRDPDGTSNAVRLPKNQDVFDGNSFPYHHPLLSHTHVYRAAEDEDLADQVWAAAEHFCSLDMKTGGNGAAARAWERSASARDFHYLWSQTSPLHGTRGSIHGRLLTVPLGTGPRHAEPAQPSGYEDYMRADRDGDDAKLGGSSGFAGQPVRSLLQDWGAAYALEPYDIWLEHSNEEGGEIADTATRHGRCPQPVIEWWMWYLVWHGTLGLSANANHTYQVEGFPDPFRLSTLLGYSNSRTREVKDAADAAARDYGVDDFDEGSVWGIRDASGSIERACPLTLPETIGYGYDPTGTEGESQLFSNEKVGAADRAFWGVAKQDIVGFHTLAHLSGCSGPVPGPGGMAEE